jgi:type VI secretion system FHA domain protein
MRKPVCSGQFYAGKADASDSSGGSAAGFQPGAAFSDTAALAAMSTRQMVRTLMMTIKAISYNGQPTEAPIQAEFDEAGGVLGRAQGNAMVLPDPGRHVSRMHASIDFHAGRYLIRDLSSASPVYLNGAPLCNGDEAQLHHGDRIAIGGYLLEVADLPANLPKSAAQGKDRVKEGGFSKKTTEIGPAGIPDDFDPFADVALPPPQPSRSQDAAAAAVAAAAAAAAGSSLGLPSATGDNIDRLFDLTPGSGNDFFLHGNPLAGPDAADVGATSGPASARDDVPEIRAAFTAPPIPSRARQPALVPDSEKPHEAIAQTESGFGHGSGFGAAQSNPLPVRSGADQDLLQAFLVGAGVPDLDMQGPLTPQMMQMFGQLLRTATQGTLDLLLARSLIKREVHAERTMIVPRENNPLKFSPNVEVALSHLLAPRGQGFMAPLLAMKDACDDLRAHQFGFMAGMRAALAGVLQRFDPVRLEQRLGAEKIADRLLPVVRKARLWSLFEQFYAQISKEAEDDFDTLFGKEFLCAYEAQLAKLEQGDDDLPH